MSRKVAWITSVSSQNKSWGTEKSWTCPGQTYNKILIIKKGHRTRLKRYKTKSESFYLVSGKLSVSYGDEKAVSSSDLKVGILNENQVLSVPSMCPYSIEALEDSIVIETSDRTGSSFELLKD